MANRALCATTTVTMALVSAQVGGAHAERTTQADVGLIMEAEGGTPQAAAATGVTNREGTAVGVFPLADASLGDKTVPSWTDY